MIYQAEFIKLIMFYLCDRTKGEHTDSQGFKKKNWEECLFIKREKNKTALKCTLNRLWRKFKKQEASVKWFVKVIEERRQAEMC